MSKWIKTSEQLPDEGVLADTKIHDHRGTRNNQPLIKNHPTHWKARGK